MLRLGPLRVSPHKLAPIQTSPFLADDAALAALVDGHVPAASVLSPCVDGLVVPGRNDGVLCPPSNGWLNMPRWFFSLCALNDTFVDWCLPNIDPHART